MKIKDKILMEQQQLIEEGPITIVALGDSVTHGALRGNYNYETVYWERLRKKILAVRDYVPVNVINAGISATNAVCALKRIDLQVLAHNPDLVIVCFGLNDVNGELETYLDALREIFEKCLAHGADVIFMTPNMLNTYVSEETEPQNIEYAAVTAKVQNEGRMDLFMESAVKLAKKMNVSVCDCYAKWKELSKAQDTTMLLVNRINHPTEEMHELFAQSLFEMIFDEKLKTDNLDSNSMYRV